MVCISFLIGKQICNQCLFIPSARARTENASSLAVNPTSRFRACWPKVQITLFVGGWCSSVVVSVSLCRTMGMAKPTATQMVFGRVSLSIWVALDDSPFLVWRLSSLNEGTELSGVDGFVSSLFFPWPTYPGERWVHSKRSFPLLFCSFALQSVLALFFWLIFLSSLSLRPIMGLFSSLSQNTSEMKHERRHFHWWIRNLCPLSGNRRCQLGWTWSEVSIPLVSNPSSGLIYRLRLRLVWGTRGTALLHCCTPRVGLMLMYFPYPVSPGSPPGLVWICSPCSAAQCTNNAFVIHKAKEVMGKLSSKQAFFSQIKYFTT